MARSAAHRPGYSSTAGREAKAHKISAILERAGHPLTGKPQVLDLGTGSGEIARNLSHTAQVIACDVLDQRSSRTGPPFVICADRLPFADAAFDVVLSNHVIEHVSSPEQHLREIHRVLKPGGIAYLATPNRLWPHEFHTGLKLLHYLPTGWFQRLSRLLGRGDELLQLQTTRSLKYQGSALFSIEYWHHRLLREPACYALKLPGWVTKLIGVLPDSLLSFTLKLHPTLICLLHRR